MSEFTKKPTVVILGSGFAGFSLLEGIDTDAFTVVVVSPRNHFLFTPLLPSTTVGTIEFRSIVEPVRTAHEGIAYYQAECTGVDPARQIVECMNVSDGTSFSLWYDILVISVGAENSTFGIPGVVEHAHFLKEISDARAIRRDIIENFERASAPGIDSAERRRLLHFVVVGGGPTGIEFAAELNDFVNEDIRSWYPHIVDDVGITVLEADKILSSFDATLREYTLKLFRRQRIQVRLKALVERVEAREIFLRDGSTLPYGLVVWSTGIGPRPFISSLPFQKNGQERILTDEFLNVKGYGNIYAAGDCATPEIGNLPATSQVAQQEGRYLAQALNRLVVGRPSRPFSYRHFGMLAYIGANRALADLAGVKGRGFATWLFWRSTYLTKLVSVKNKILVVFDWCKTLIFGRDISRF
jgi:NADH:ubiquinone reductase (non-electrogenic)